MWGDTQKATRQQSIFLLPATLPSSTPPSSTIVEFSDDLVGELTLSIEVGVAEIKFKFY